jgi:hypothetical protein
LSANNEPFNIDEYGCRSENKQDTYKADIKVLTGFDGPGKPWKATEIEVFKVDFV